MNSFIPITKPNITDKDIAAVVEVLNSGMLVQGKHVDLLEQKFVSYTGAKYASALSNGTATLHLALKSLQIGPGDEVIVPAFSYVATANAVELVGAKPVFVDIELGTFNIDVSKIEAAVSPKTKAIIPVHEFGLACDLDPLMEIARKNNLFVIEDAACALGAQYKNKHVGTVGDFGSFSLHPRKAITSGEGGILITNNEALNSKVRVLRNHGIELVDGKMDFVDFGFNYRLTDIQAALVYFQMDKLQESISYKNELALIYGSELNKEKIKLPSIPDYTSHTWQTYHVILQDEIKRDDVIAKLKENNIGSNYGAQCIPYMTAYMKKYKYDCKHLFPNALKAYNQGLALPIYDLLGKSQVEFISKTLNDILK